MCHTHSCALPLDCVCVDLIQPDDVALCTQRAPPPEPHRHAHCVCGTPEVDGRAFTMRFRFRGCLLSGLCLSLLPALVSAYQLDGLVRVTPVSRALWGLCRRCVLTRPSRRFPPLKR